VGVCGLTASGKRCLPRTPTCELRIADVRIGVLCTKNGAEGRLASPFGEERSITWTSAIIGAGDFGLAGRVFDVEGLHHAVVDHHGIALRAHAEPALGQVRGQSRAPWPSCRCRRRETRWVAAGRLLPGVHTNTSLTPVNRDGVDALGLDRGRVLDGSPAGVLVAGRVKAPGTANSTTFLPLNNSSVVFGFGPSPVIT